MVRVAQPPQATRASLNEERTAPAIRIDMDATHLATEPTKGTRMHPLPPPSVRLFVCGTAERGDDGAALSAVATLLPVLPSALLERLEVRRCGHLRAEDILGMPAGEIAVVIDAATGVPPGHVVALPIRTLGDTSGGPMPRSFLESGLEATFAAAHAETPDAMPEGIFIGIGGRRFGYGRPLSRSVRLAMASFQRVIAAELARVANVPETPASS